ncbi:MAG TPA: hypothetical protein VM487_25995 [Phycisphaerae bacterium]|nr:hypothetical protein [Phycisphaerae bacterium]
MAAPTILQGDVRVMGEMDPVTIDYPAGSIVDADINANAAIGNAKQKHLHAATLHQTGTMVAGTHAVHCAYGALGVIKSVKAGSVTACTGNAAATVDVKINGTTCLTGTFALDSSNAAYTPEAGTIDTGADDVAADDVITVVVTVDAGTGALGTGLYVTVVVEEDGAP